MTGKTKWKLKYYPNINKRIGGKKYNNSGANPWGGISFDEEREIIFLTTGNPHSYFDGTLRPGNNIGSSSIVAIDIKNKKKIWTFQETFHDIWNSDLPAPPGYIWNEAAVLQNAVDAMWTNAKGEPIDVFVIGTPSLG